MLTGTATSSVVGAGFLRPEPPARLAQRRLLPSSSSRMARADTSNGFRTHCMKTWNPFTNTRYEALSYLAPLTPESIAKEVEFIIAKGWIPCLEFDKVGKIHRSNSRMPGYYDGRYWTLWKLPIFGCADAAEVLREVDTGESSQTLTSASSPSTARVSASAYPSSSTNPTMRRRRRHQLELNLTLPNAMASGFRDQAILMLDSRQ